MFGPGPEVVSGTKHPLLSRRTLLLEGRGRRHSRPTGAYENTRDESTRLVWYIMLTKGRISESISGTLVLES